MSQNYGNFDVRRDMGGGQSGKEKNMDYEKTIRNLRGQAVFVAQNCHGPAYEKGGVIRALKEGADAIEELLREKQAPQGKVPLGRETLELLEEPQPWEEPTQKGCFNCAHLSTPHYCAPCKNCIRVSPGVQDYWKKDGDL